MSNDRKIPYKDSFREFGDDQVKQLVGSNCGVGQPAVWGKLRREPQRSIERAETLMRVMGLEIAIIEGLINTVIGRRIAEICCRSIRIRSYRLLEHV